MSNVIDLEQARQNRQNKLLAKMLAEALVRTEGLCMDRALGFFASGYPCRKPKGHDGLCCDREGWTWQRNP